MTINEIIDNQLENDIIELDLRKSFKEFLLSEAKQVGDVYHFTELSRLLPILSSNKLKIGINGLTISLTRDFDLPRHSTGYFDNGDYIVRFTIDGNKLSENLFIRPYSDERYEDEREEIIQKEIKNLSKFIKKVEIISTGTSMYTKEQILALEPTIKKYTKNYEFVKKFGKEKR